MGDDVTPEQMREIADVCDDIRQDTPDFKVARFLRSAADQLEQARKDNAEIDAIRQRLANENDALRAQLDEVERERDEYKAHDAEMLKLLEVSNAAYDTDLDKAIQPFKQRAEQAESRAARMAEALNGILPLANDVAKLVNGHSWPYIDNIRKITQQALAQACEGGKA